MNIRPLYDRIVVKRIKEQETTRSGIVIPDSAKEKPQEGEVMAVGYGKRLEDGELVALDVKVGDRILFGKYSGSEIKVDGDDFLIQVFDQLLQHRTERAGKLRGGYHIDIEVAEHFAVFGKRLRKTLSAFDSVFQIDQYRFEFFSVNLFGDGFQRILQADAGPDHHGELVGKVQYVFARRT